MNAPRLNSATARRWQSALFSVGLVCCLTLLMFLFAPTSLAAAPSAAPLKAFTAEFDLFRDDDKVGESVIRLAPLNDNEWQMQAQSSASLYFMTFSDHEQSRLQWREGRPQPLSFDKERQRPGKTETVHQQFDWQQQLDSGNRGKKKWSVPLKVGTQDLQSHLLALQLDLRAGKRELHYPVSKNGRVRDYHYQVTKEEVLDTALGKLPTLRVERIRDADDSRQTITWFAPSLDYVAVRIQQYEDGELQGDMQIRKLTR
jgi:hypothetical protein